MVCGNIYKFKFVVAVLTLALLIYLTNFHQISNSRFPEEADKINEQQIKITFKPDNEENRDNLINRDKLFKYLSDALRGTPYPGVHNYTSYMTTFLEKKELKGAEPLLPSFTPVVNDVAHFTYDIEVKCLHVVENAVTVFVALNSAAGNVQRRNAIRETWLKQLKNLGGFQQPDDQKVRLAGFAFFIGQTVPEVNLTRESEQFNDILLIDAPDAYYNISMKLSAALYWIESRCKRVDLVLKGDDDIFINIKSFLRLIKQLDSHEVGIYGSITGATVLRSGRWGMTYEEYPWRGYPYYLSGGSYLITGKALRPLLAATQTVPFHPFDDLYLTGFCSERANVTIYHAENFFRLQDFHGRPPTPCFTGESISWLLHGNPRMMYESYNVTETYYNGGFINCTMKGKAVLPGKEPDFSIKKFNFLRTR